MPEINVDARLVRGGPTALTRVDERLVELTNGCILLTEAELAAGPAAWGALPDPWPAWHDDFATVH